MHQYVRDEDGTWNVLTSGELARLQHITLDTPIGEVSVFTPIEEPQGREDASNGEVALGLALGDRADDADFKESEHPRDEDGQFTSGGGGTGGRARLEPTKTVNNQRLTASGAPLPEHIAKLKIPPAWTDVHYAKEPGAALLVAGRDGKGRMTAIYSTEHSAHAAAVKYARIAELSAKFDKIRKQNEDARRAPATRDVADCLAVVMDMGIRPGSDSDTGAAVQAYGATTLEGRHVRVTTGGKVSLQFTGKKGVALNLPVTDEKLAAMLLKRKDKAGPKGRVFGDVSHHKLLAHTHSMNGGGFKTKDFRTHLGTTTAAKLVASREAPTDAKSYKKAVMEVARAVSEKLGNTPTIALQSYINPVVFADWSAAA
jgi:DNA topoisomerase I